MKTKKNQYLVFLTAFGAIFLAMFSLVAVNEIMAQELRADSKIKVNSTDLSTQEDYSKDIEEIEKELKPEVKIEVRELEEDQIEEKREVINKEEENSTNEIEEQSGEIIQNKEEEQANEVSEIRGEVEGADQVEYNLVKRGSVEPNIYLGEAQKNNQGDEEYQSDNEWSLKYDFSNVPVGEYDLYAEVRNQYGTYTSERTPITIKEEEKYQAMGERIQLGQEGITIKVSNIKNNNTGQRLKEITKQQEEIRNNPNLTEEEKELKLKQLEENKEQLINEFNFRNQIEEIYKKQGDKNLTEEDRQALEEVKEILKVDSDGDGLPDHEELRIGSDPFSADTDQDGYLDGDEVVNGYDPLTPSTKDGIDKIVFDEPKNSGKENILYQVEDIDFVEQESDVISFKGRALPNSFITLYIYSNPVVVTVKTDEDGNWSYVLSKELEDGNHEVYAAVTDNTGKITSKSKPLAFIKTAQAIQLMDDNRELSQINSTLSPIENEKNKLLIFVISISIFSLISAIVSIVLLIKNNREKLDD
jgi:hypothetical protein